MNPGSSDSYDGSAQHLDVAVIGGGQAGLAIGCFLGQHGSRFVILERASESAPAWRERWDSLTLFTPRRYSALPRPSLPWSPGRLRDPRRGHRLPRAVRRDLRAAGRAEQRGRRSSTASDDGRFGLELVGRTIVRRPGRGRDRSFPDPVRPEARREARRRPLPDPCRRLPPAGDVPKGTVLVVGGGNTGFQIAKELSATHAVVLSIGSQQEAAAPARARARSLLVADQDAPPQQDGRVTPRPQAGDARHADRLEPARNDEALRR